MLNREICFILSKPIPKHNLKDVDILDELSGLEQIRAVLVMAGAIAGAHRKLRRRTP